MTSEWLQSQHKRQFSSWFRTINARVSFVSAASGRRKIFGTPLSEIK